MSRSIQFRPMWFKGQLYLIFPETHSCCHFEQGGAGQETVLLFVNCFHEKEGPVLLEKWAREELAECDSGEGPSQTSRMNTLTTTEYHRHSSDRSGNCLSTLSIFHCCRFSFYNKHLCLQSEKLQVLRITLVTVSRKIKGKHDEEDLTQGGEKQEDEAPRALSRALRVPPRKRSHDQGSVMMAAQEVTSLFPGHSPRAPHMPQTRPYPDTLLTLPRKKEGVSPSHTGKQNSPPRSSLTEFQSCFTPSLHLYTPLLFWSTWSFLPPSGIFPPVFTASAAEDC